MSNYLNILIPEILYKNNNFGGPRGYIWGPMATLGGHGPLDFPLPHHSTFSEPLACREGEGGGSENLDFYKVLEETLTRQ